MKRIFTDLQNELADLIEGGEDRKICRQEYSCLIVFLSTIFLSATDVGGSPTLPPQRGETRQPRLKAWVGGDHTTTKPQRGATRFSGRVTARWALNWKGPQPFPRPSAWAVESGPVGAIGIAPKIRDVQKVLFPAHLGHNSYLGLGPSTTECPARGARNPTDRVHQEHGSSRMRRIGTD
jgi:hypothetical protein